jgi:hypothetical protein
MSEIAENMQEGLLALAVGAGLQVMAALMEADVTELAGPKGRHDEARTAVRHGRERGSVTLGGRRVPVTRPRRLWSPPAYQSRHRPTMRNARLVATFQRQTGGAITAEALSLKNRCEDRPLTHFLRRPRRDVMRVPPCGVGPLSCGTSFG